MTSTYDQVLAALRDRTGLVHLDVRPPRDAPTKELVAHLFALRPGNPGKPQGQAVSLAVTEGQARELIAAGAEWHGPAHLRAEVLP